MQQGSDGDQRVVLLRSESHGQHLLSVLQRFREKHTLFDFSICVQNQNLPCHRCVLAACSHFFRALFELDMQGHDDASVTLSVLSPQAVRSFLDFAYTGEIEIRNDNVEMLFQMASFLQVDFLSHGCSDFLIRTLQLSNCLELLALAEGYGSTCLLHKVTEFITHNFHCLLSDQDFLEVPALVFERCLVADALSAPDEESVLHFVLKWTRHKPQIRQKLLPGLLAHVRLHHVPFSTLEEMVDGEELVSGDEKCSRAIRDASVRVQEFEGLFLDARPSTTSTYIFVHKTMEEEGTRHAFCYNVTANHWRELPLDAARLLDTPGSSLTSFGEKLFVIGGCQQGCTRSVRLHISESHHDATNNVWVYCPISRVFAPAVPMEHPRSMHASIRALGRIFVIGGKPSGPCGNASLVDVECLDPLVPQWTSVSPLPKAIYFPEVSVCGSAIYLLGSEVENTEVFNPLLDCFFRYNIEADQWCQLVAEFGQFFHATLVKTVSVEESLYVCDLSTYRVFSFSTSSGAWRPEASFECAGFNANAIEVDGKIYILGGDYAPKEISDEVQVYDSRSSEWQEVAPMPHPLTEFHCVAMSFSAHRDPWKTEVENSS